MKDSKIEMSFKWGIWVFTLCFGFFDCLLRSYPSVSVDLIMKAFHIDAEVVGTLDSLYFYTYALMQIPAGLLLDRFGARKVLPWAAALTGIGSILYGIAPVYALLGIARIIEGIGAAFAFLGIIYVTSHWFSHERFALLVGLGAGFSALGTFSGQGPIAMLMRVLSWRAISVSTGVVIIIIGVLIFLAEHFHPKKQHLLAQSKSLLEAFKGLKEVLAQPQSWLAALVTFFMVATTSGLGDLWGISFLVKTHHLHNTLASFAISMVAIGWLIGAPLIGYISDRLRKRRPLIMIGSLGAFFALLPVIYLHTLPIPLIFILMLLVGIFSSSLLQTFTLALMHNHDRAAGSTSAFINFASLAAAAFFQFFVGFALNLLWEGHKAHGVQVFVDKHWTLILSIFPLTLLIGFVLSFFLKEYYHEEY